MKPSSSLLRPLTLAAILCASAMQVTGAAAQTGARVDGPSAAVTAVRFHVEPGQTRVWLETTGAVLYTHYSPDPLTLVVDLPGVDVSSLATSTHIGSSEVESITVTTLEGVNGKRLNRIELKLATIAPYQITGSEQALNIVFDGGNPTTPDLGTNAEAVPTTTPEALVADEPASSLPVETMAEEETAMITEPAAPSAPPAGPTYPASLIQQISHQREGEVLRVQLEANGRLNYTTFELDGPSRLVFDFNGVLNAVPRKAIDIDALGVSRVRVAQYRSADPQITRVVFDLEDYVAHQVTESRGGIEVAFARSDESLSRPATFASLQPDEPAAEPEGQTLSTPPVAPSSTSDGTIADTAYDDASNELAVTEVDEPRTVTTLTANSEGAYLVRDASYEEPGGGGIAAAVAGQDLAFMNPAPEPPAALPVPPPPAQGNPGSQDPTSITGGEMGGTSYQGELISLDFKDGDIQDIFRLFADISGLNIVVQPGVTGRITLKLTEVPWDQALELVLKTNKLGFIAEGNVIRIAPLTELAAEEAEKRQLAEEQALAGELFTNTRVLSYAKADEIMPLLQRNLSPRGDIVIDERTNTVIFTDLPAFIAGINTLIDDLDTPIPGVEIESRIVVTTRTFARQLGVQWGFTSNQTQALGNTTELVFPNRVQFDGQAIGSDAQRNFAVPGATTGGLAPPQVTEGTLQVQRGYAVNLPFAGAPTGAVGLSLGSITGAFNIDAAISAAERRGQVRIISAPKIITQNNKPARISQGTTFPVQVVANNTITVQFKEALLDLNVTPQITSAETIILDIQVNNDSLDFGRAVNGIPSIVTQAATTQVLVPDGSTTVIGGVFVNTTQEEEQYVPLLHKIPVLGYLFKTKNVDTRNEELLIFLTPRIRKDTV